LNHEGAGCAGHFTAGRNLHKLLKLRILSWPCDTYNYSTQNTFSSASEEPARSIFPILWVPLRERVSGLLPSGIRGSQTSHFVLLNRQHTVVRRELIVRRERHPLKRQSSYVQ